MTVQEIADRLGGRIEGEASARITGIAMVREAVAGDLVFLGSERYVPAWAESPAVAALVSSRLAEKVPRRPGTALILVDDADIALAKLLDLFTAPPAEAGMPAIPPDGAVAIHPSAVVDATARLGGNVRIGAGCVVGPRVVVGGGTILQPGVTLYDDAVIGRSCVLWTGVVVRENCVVGDRCVLHSHVVVGTDGFGYRPSSDGRGIVKIPHLGDVEIGNDVEIGANSCVDRGKLSSTVIGDLCKIDNLCQIGHNSRLGRAVMVAGKVGISGSVTIGDGVLIGGGAGIADHVTIGAGAQIAAAAGVMRDVPAGVRVSGIPARHIQQFFREQSALAKLPDILRPPRRNWGEGVPAVAPPTAAFPRA